MAKFSRAHYVLIAGAVRQARIATVQNPDKYDTIEFYLSEMFQKDNPKFQPGLFKEFCKINKRS